MERVSPADLGSPLSAGKAETRGNAGGSRKSMEGSLVKKMGTGLFLAVLEDGREIKVRGSGALKVGDSVEVLAAKIDAGGSAASDPVLESLGQAVQWSAFLPLGFGGKGASANLEVFVQKQPKGLSAKKSGAYLIFTVKTELQGEIQWSIHLMGKQVFLQVYAPGEDRKEKLSSMVQEVEKSLKNRGFTLGGLTIYLNGPFRLPDGYRLNVRG